MSRADDAPQARPERRLSLWDCTSILVGIIIGSGIYESTGLVSLQVESLGALIGLWIAGAVFALLGALCYAELATRFPEEGGDYVYLTRAFGRPIGFLFAWTQLWVIRPGSIGALACVFAKYAEELLPLGEHSFLWYACGSIAVLTGVNMLGVPQGRVTQNILSTAKILGIAVLVGGAFMFGDGPRHVDLIETDGSLSLAMIFVLFAYSGWNEMGCVAAEVREPRRNIWRALLLGTTLVAAAYLGINLACAHVLGLAGMQLPMQGVPAAAAEAMWGLRGRQALSLLICISALGSTNGMIFTGARIYYAMGKRHRMFAPLAVWSPRFGTPLVSLALQAAVTLGLVVGFSSTGSAVAARSEAFGRLVIFMTPPFYLFLIGSAAAVLIFRAYPTSGDSFRMPLYPVPPLVVIAAAAFLAYNGVMYVVGMYQQAEDDRLRWPAVWVVGTLASGLVLGLLERKSSGPVSEQA